MHTPPTPRAWYQQFWVWFVILWPAVAVVAGISTVIIAVRFQDDLVVDDYYRVGKAINQDIARDQEAERLGLSAQLHYDTGRLRLSLTPLPPAPEPSLWLNLHHPTQAREDQALSLTWDGTHYTVQTTVLAPARWRLQLSPPDRRWRLRGELALPHLHHAELRPSR